ncbi:MAG: crossover junction endodeoxyribonuclease RuvC [Thermodesulfobacteriota bacterium]
MRVLGIDPGSIVTGFAILEKGNNGLIHVHSGAIRPSARESFAVRLKGIYRSLQTVINNFEPDDVAIEGVFLAKNPQSAIKLSHVRGVTMLASAEAGLEIYEYSPRAVKLAVVGYGQASKEQVQKMVQALVSLKEMPSPDTADALAVAICHIHTTISGQNR